MFHDCTHHHVMETTSSLTLGAGDGLLAEVGFLAEGDPPERYTSDKLSGA